MLASVDEFHMAIYEVVIKVGKLLRVNNDICLDSCVDQSPKCADLMPCQSVDFSITAQPINTIFTILERLIQCIIKATQSHYCNCLAATGAYFGP